MLFYGFNYILLPYSHKRGDVSAQFSVATAYEFGKFYDAKRTIELMKEPEVEVDKKTGGRRKNAK